MNVTNSLLLFSFHRWLFCKRGLTKNSFPHRSFMFPQATSFLEHKVVCMYGSHKILSLTEVLLFCKHADSWIMGESDMSQVSTYVFRRQDQNYDSKLGHKSALQKLNVYNWGKIPTKIWQDPLTRSWSLARIPWTAWLGAERSWLAYKNPTGYLKSETIIYYVIYMIKP